MAIITKSEPDDNPSGALILYENLLISVTSSALGRGNALTPSTYDRWVDPSGDMIATYLLAAPTVINSVGIAAHNLGGKNTAITIEIAESFGGAFTTHGSITPVDDKPLLFTFDSKLAAEVKIRGTLTGSDVEREIGVVYAGNTLQMPRNIYGGHSPIALSQVTEFQSTESESGQFLGENIIRKGLETSFAWQFLDDGFIRDTFKRFIDSARTLPFFIEWRPDFYSDEVAYCKVRQDIKPVNMGGGGRLMSVSFSAKGHADL